MSVALSVEIYWIIATLIILVAFVAAIIWEEVQWNRRRDELYPHDTNIFEVTDSELSEFLDEEERKYGIK